MAEVRKRITLRALAAAEKVAAAATDQDTSQEEKISTAHGISKKGEENEKQASFCKTCWEREVIEEHASPPVEIPVYMFRFTESF